MYDVAIVGFGPAGASAALYTVRAGFSTLLVGRDGGSVEKAAEIDNYYGVGGPVSGAELLERGLSQAKRLGCGIMHAEVLGLGWNGNYTLTTGGGEIQARSVILATGAKRGSAPVKGLSRLDGAGVSWCAVCDGFFHRGKPVAVLGAGEYARHECEQLIGVAGSVTVLTNGEKLLCAMPDGADVIEKPVAELLGDGRLSGVRFEDGTELELSGLFVAVGAAGGTELARKIGAPVENGCVAVDAEMATMLPGLFAAGDCAGTVRQVSVAVGQGAIAGMSAARWLRAQK